MHVFKKTMKFRNAKSLGFTFVELMIAVTIFSVIAVSIYSVFHSGLRVWSKMGPIVEGNQAVRVLFNTMAQDLKSAVVYQPGEVNFEGDGQRVALMTLVQVAGSDQPLHTELAKVVYFYDKDTKSVKRLVAGKAEGLDETKAKAEDYLTGVGKDDFGFEYCYKDSYAAPDADYKWKNVWSEKGKIPRGIRVHFGEFKKLVFIPTGEMGVLQ